MKFFEATVGAIIIRFYLMVAVVIIAGFTGQWWLSVLALPILLSAMTGISFKSNKNRAAKSSTLDPKNKSEAA